MMAQNLYESDAWSKRDCEYLRWQAKQRFDNVRESWIQAGQWANPYRVKWLLSQRPGERNNQHNVDPTHIVALRSYAAGFLEGNTSASRPWYRILGQDPDTNSNPGNKAWLELYTRRTLAYFAKSNFYHAAGQFYYDYGTFNTGAYFIEDRQDGVYYHILTPGGYFPINDNRGVAVVLVREFDLTVKALVSAYGQKTKDGSYNWSNFSSAVKNMYDKGNYSQVISVAQITYENPHFDPTKKQVLSNRQWVTLTYELGGTGGQYYQDGQNFNTTDDSYDPMSSQSINRWLRISFSKRKPFIVGKSYTNDNFEYGETGPTYDALGLIRSINKKAISKDQAIEQMLRPTIQGPANLKKSYRVSAPNSYIPLDATALSNGGLRPVNQINSPIVNLVNDVQDLRHIVEQIYYADFLLYLSRNPKTRTATETTAVVQEQQLVVGPNLQSLNWTHNVPHVEFMMDWVLDNDPYLPPPPPSLQGQQAHPEFVSIFAQAQKAADLPSIDSYMQHIVQVGQQPGGAKIWDKVNLDKFADLLEDRLFLPSGLNNPQAIVDQVRQQQAQAAQQQQMMQQTLPAVAGAAKDFSAAKGNQ